jgi:hypothetical protein
MRALSTLSHVHIPMLFLQGTRDDFAALDYLRPLVERLGSLATLKLFEDADHSFHVRAKSGHTDAEIMTDLLDTIMTWSNEIAS